MVEAVFGPDPGLLRLRTAGRTVLSAATTLTALLLLYGNAGTRAAAPIALGFMVSNFANMSVRDQKPWQQGLSLALLALPALGCVALSSFLSAWPWAADLGFVAVIAAATLARMLGPRGMSMGMVAFISYFIGVVTRPPLWELPQMAVAVSIAIAAAGFIRIVVLPDRPRAALRQVRVHIRRRVNRILSEVDEVLSSDATRPTPRQEEARRHRMHREIARLNDALLIAEDQIEELEETESEELTVRERFFALELAAERLMRLAARHRHAPDRAIVRAQIAELQEFLSTNRTLSMLDAAKPAGELGTALAELQRALADLARAWADMDTARAARPPGSAGSERRT